MDEALEDTLGKCGWEKMKQLTPQEHWLLSDSHKKNWHGEWIRYIATTSDAGETSYSIQEAKYGIRNIAWSNAEKTESSHQNFYFDEEFKPTTAAGPWRNDVTNSTPEGVGHAASAAATTLYLPDGSVTWASKRVDLELKPFSVAAELFLRPDNNTRVSVVAFYKGAAFGGVSLIREEARESPDTLDLRPKDGTSFWTYEKELPAKRTDIAAELIGTEMFITSHGLVLLEREGRFGGYGGAQRGASGSADVDAFGPSVEAEMYEVVRLPENLSLRCPKKLIEGRRFELSAAMVTADGMGASQSKVLYGSDWKLKGLMHGIYFA